MMNPGGRLSPLSGESLISPVVLVLKVGCFFSNLYNWRMREIKRCMQFLEIATVNCQV